jgi:hypothetical protein
MNIGKNETYFKDKLTRTPTEIKPIEIDKDTTEDKINKILKLSEKSIKSMRALENILSIFHSVGNKFNNVDISSKTFMNEGQIFNALCNYMQMSSLTLLVNDKKEDVYENYKNIISNLIEEKKQELEVLINEKKSIADATTDKTEQQKINNNIFKTAQYLNAVNFIDQKINEAADYDVMRYVDFEQTYEIKKNVEATLDTGVYDNDVKMNEFLIYATELLTEKTDATSGAITTPINKEVETLNFVIKDTDVDWKRNFTVTKTQDKNLVNLFNYKHVINTLNREYYIFDQKITGTNTQLSGIVQIYYDKDMKTRPSFDVIRDEAKDFTDQNFNDFSFIGYLPNLLPPFRLSVMDVNKYNEINGYFPIAYFADIIKVLPNKHNCSVEYKQVDKQLNITLADKTTAATSQIFSYDNDKTLEKNIEDFENKVTEINGTTSGITLHNEIKSFLKNFIVLMKKVVPAFKNKLQEYISFIKKINKKNNNFINVIIYLKS